MIKNGKWNLLKLSFGHLEDDIGLAADGMILPNAIESHEILLDFITDFLVENIRNCKDPNRSYQFKIGTDNSQRDINVGDAIIKLLMKKLKLNNIRQRYKNDFGVYFDLYRLEVIVKQYQCIIYYLYLYDNITFYSVLFYNITFYNIFFMKTSS